MKQYFLILLLIVGSILSSFASDKVLFNHIGFESGLTELNINGLYQDENGTLWIGTGNGVKKYNGSKIESLEIPELNNLSLTAFPTICGDKKGHLFIAVDNRLVEYNLQTDTYKVIYLSSRNNSSINFSFSYGNNSLWIGFKDSLYTYKDGHKRLYIKLPDKNAVISSIKESSSGNTYIGTKNKGFFCVDTSKKITRVISDCTEVISIYEDSKKNIWAGTFDKGVYCIKPDGVISNYTTDSKSIYKLTCNYVRAICEDNDGNIWMGTMLGLDEINRASNSLRHYGLSENGKSALSNLSVWVILKDNQGTIWFGTYYGGLDYINTKSVSFAYNDFGTHYSGNGYPIIGKVVKDKRGDLWMCTEGKGLLYLNSKTNAYRFITQGTNSVSTNNLKSLYYDAETDKLWIGTHLGGLNGLDIKTMRFKHYDIDPTSENTASEIVHALTKYKNTLYIGTILRMYEMDITTEKITQIKPLINQTSNIQSLLVDKNLNLWIAGNNLCTYNVITKTIKNYNQELNKITSTSQHLTTAIYENKKGEIIIALKGYGLIKFNRNANVFSPLKNQNKELESTNITSLNETSNGLLLAGTNVGFSCIDFKNNKCVNYNSKNGFPLYSMLPGGICKVENDVIIFSGINGVSFLNSKALAVYDQPFKLYVSKLLINNKVISTGDNTKILEQNISSTKKINLKYYQNTISIEIGQDNFVNLGHPSFQYRLSGFDNNWIDFSPKTSIKYMNLPTGTYTLKVRAKFINEARSPQTELVIRVNPPFYLAWYAYVFYFIIIAGVSVWLILSSRARLLLQTSLEIERRSKEHQESAIQSKLRFFANISHELRTPLTLIIGQLELLLTNKSYKRVHNKLNDLHKNASEMSELINELMDFQKHDQGMFKIKVIESDIVSYLREIYQSFLVLAELKEFDFSFESSNDEILIWFDQNQLHKVFNNLLSNAFKYTPKAGKIQIVIKDFDSKVNVSVIDTGIGISEQHKEMIFERFFQIENASNNEISKAGTGIGLSLSERIVKVHSGVICVESEENKGSEFTVELQKGNSHFEGNDMVEIILSQHDFLSNVFVNKDDEDFQNEIVELQNTQSVVQPTILIVEDDDELRNLLVQIFDPISLILEAKNGNEGLTLAQEKLPDLILSDVMMPGMSGFELCTKIKTNFETCHLPVILLTALNTVEQTIGGLNCGADDYITKPFNVKILITKCLGFLNNRRILQEKFSKQMDESSVTLTTNTLDQNFVDQVIQIIENNIENGEINISILCNEMGISRTILFSKMKVITGKTPHEFIQNIKLKIAARMLRENCDMNITEVSEYLGFSSLNYFGKTFKEHFGITPKSIRNEMILSTKDQTEE